MMLNVAQQKNQWFSAKESSKHIPIGLIVSVIIFFELILSKTNFKLSMIKTIGINRAKAVTQKLSLCLK